MIVIESGLRCHKIATKVAAKLPLPPAHHANTDTSHFRARYERERRKHNHITAPGEYCKVWLQIVLPLRRPRKVPCGGSRRIRGADRAPRDGRPRRHACTGHGARKRDSRPTRTHATGHRAAEDHPKTRTRGGGGPPQNDHPKTKKTKQKQKDKDKDKDVRKKKRKKATNGNDAGTVSARLKD